MFLLELFQIQVNFIKISYWDSCWNFSKQFELCNLTLGGFSKGPWNLLQIIWKLPSVALENKSRISSKKYCVDFLWNYFYEYPSKNLMIFLRTHAYIQTGFPLKMQSEWKIIGIIQRKFISILLLRFHKFLHIRKSRQKSSEIVGWIPKKNIWNIYF